VLDGTRKVLHLLVLLFVLLLVLASLAPNVPRIPAAGALVLAPEGDIVEQLSGNPLERAVCRFKKRRSRISSKRFAARKTTIASRFWCCSSTA
jgi:hypothetical protein